MKDFPIAPDITSENLTQQVLDHISEGYWIWYVKEDYEYMSPRFWEILGFLPHEKRHHPSEWQAHVFPADLPILFESFNQHVQTRGKSPFSVQVRYKHKNGKTVWIKCEGKVIDWDESGAPVRVIGTHRDITTEKQQQIISDAISELRATYIELTTDRPKFFEYLLGNILNLTESVYGFIGEVLEDEDGKFLKTYWISDISWNEETKKLYQDVAPHFIFRNLNTLFGSVIKSGKPLLTNDAPHHPEAYGIPKGHPPLNAFMGIPIYYSGKFIAMAGVANRDIGYDNDFLNMLSPYFDVIGEMIHAKLIEDELQKQINLTMHNARLASIGQLAAGVGHEINNPLTIISGQLFFMEQGLSKAGTLDGELETRILKIKNSINRITNIVRGLKTFSRSDDDKLGRFDLYELILETTDMLKDIFQQEGVTLQFDSKKFEGIVFGNRGRIQQVLVNLISNAKDATNAKSDRQIGIYISKKLQEISVSISDNGCGISDEIKDRIFDPFFTTKDINKGTGIGLSLVNTIIKEHHGKIDLQTKVNVGTTFTFTLPLQNTPGVRSIEDSSKASKKVLFDCEILIVDDEEDIREILGLLVGSICRKVHLCSNGQEALTFLKDHPVKVVISDMKMPEMDGFKLLDQVLKMDFKERPEFVFISGGVDLHPAQEQIMRDFTQGMISKPFTLEDIIKKLEQIVN
jgi:PAS domain S-box-containing protein